MKGLQKVLRDHKTEQILDCASGTGFLTLDLIKLGYNITCSDGSLSMIRQFEKNATSLGLNVKPHHLLWSQVGERWPSQFNVVMCRGSSLIYAGGWDRARKNNFVLIEEALASFYKAIEPGGMLYVDTTSSRNIERRVEKNVFKGVNRGKKFVFHETVTLNKKSGVRIWKPSLAINGHPAQEFVRYSAYLPHAKLMKMLLNCGFKSVKKVKVEGEHYDVFIAKK